MRNVAPIALDGVTPRDLSGEPGPGVELVDPRGLMVDEQYQRNPSARTLALVRKMVAEWSWSKFKAPVVVRVSDALHVLDGQHTAMAAASHPGIAAIPVLVVAAPEVADRAAAFVSHAVDRVQAARLQVHRAAVVAGDPAALAVEDVCRLAGVALLHSAPRAGEYRPRETVALGSIRALLARRGADAAREALAALAEADLTPVSGDHVLIAEALLHDEAYAGEFDPARVTAAFRALTPAIMGEARELAAAKGLPAWRALAATLCRRAAKRPRAKALPAPPAPPARVAPPPAPRIARPPLPVAERLGTRTKAPDGVRTFGALAAIVMPSAELAAIVGPGPLLRSDAVEAVSKYIRVHDLLDAVDRRVVVADPKLRAVLGRERASTSELEALFAPHLASVSERGAAEVSL